MPSASTKQATVSRHGCDGFLAGRSALVTGASRGTGCAIALSLAANGADVAINYQTDWAAAEAVVDQVRGMGRRACAIRADIGNREDIERLSTAVGKALGPVSILVNNAGIGGSLGRMADVATDEVPDRSAARGSVSALLHWICAARVDRHAEWLHEQGGRLDRADRP